jgi:hypothetical protein
MKVFALIHRPYAYALSSCLKRVSFDIQKGLTFQLTSSPVFIPTKIEVKLLDCISDCL